MRVNCITVVHVVDACGPGRADGLGRGVEMPRPTPARHSNACRTPHQYCAQILDCGLRGLPTYHHHFLPGNNSGSGSGSCGGSELRIEL